MVSPLSNKTSRFRARQRQRGAAVFIVVMAIMLLTSIGVWSMHSAAMVDQASGFSRTSVQTQLAAELSINTSMGMLGFWASELYPRSVKTPDDCIATRGISPKLPCKAIYLEEMSSATQKKTNSATAVVLAAADTATQTAGSLGLEAAPDARLITEMSDGMAALVPGQDNSKPIYQRVTLSGMAVLRPGGTTTFCDATTSSPERNVNSIASTSRVLSTGVIGPIGNNGANN